MAGLAALAASYIMSQFYRSFLAVLAPVLIADLGVTKAQLSTALGAWFMAFALAQFLVGPMLDRIGPRWTAASLFAFGGGGGAAVFALSSGPASLIVALTLMGIGCAPVLMAAFFVLRRRFSPAKLATYSALFIAVGNLGNLAGATPLAWAAQAYGWRNVGWGLCAVSVAIALAIVLLVRLPDRAGGPSRQGGSYRKVLSIRLLWPIFPIMSLTYASVANLRGLWAGPYFAEVQGYDVVSVGNVTFLMALAMIAGTLVYGPMDRVLNSRKTVISGGTAVLTATLVAWALWPEGPAWFATGALLVIGFAGLSYPVIMAHGLAFVPDHMTGRGSTLLNFFSIGGAGVMQWLSGGVFTAAGYQAVFWLYALTAGGSLVAYQFARDAKPDG
ncbi:MFS transporter [Rhizobiaceae bacterium]|nr:MFS transporter [Rhizobiaceae bacterium]